MKIEVALREVHDAETELAAELLRVGKAPRQRPRRLPPDTHAQRLV